MDKKTEAELLSKIPPNPNAKKAAADRLKKKGSNTEMAEISKLFQKMMEPAKEIKTVGDETIIFPQLLFDAEFDLIYTVKKLIGKLEGRSWETILDDMLDLPDAKEQLLKIASIIIGRDETFIRENFTMGMLVSLLAPFLASIVLGKNKGNLFTIFQKALLHLSNG